MLSFYPGTIPIANENSRFMKAYSAIFESCSVGQSSQYSSIACGWPQSQLPNMTSTYFQKFGNSHSRWVYLGENRNGYLEANALASPWASSFEKLRVIEILRFDT